ncbi:MAG TPA: addiction module antidote protein, HigA family [Oceanospirillaceae bacterium]|nr:addiction module antidote protein, HigA family [Oceanospirillaceae bacterium]
MTIVAIHPGEHLREFVEEFEITRYRLASEIHVQQTRVNEIINGKRSITADTAVRLGRYFGTTAHFWMNLQTQYDVTEAEQNITESIQCVA